MYVNGAYTGTIHTYTIHRDDGKRFELTNQYDNIEKFGDHLMRTVHARMRQRYLDAYREGHTLDFAAIKVSPYGIGSGVLPLPWNQYSGCVLQGGQLYLYQTGERTPFYSTPAAGIANLYILLDVLRAIHHAPVNTG
jgi:hypothetical protein